MKRLIEFGVMLFFLIAIAQWGLGFLASFGAEYRLYKMRDPFENIQYVMKVAKTFDWVDRMLTSFGIADSGGSALLSKVEPIGCSLEKHSGDRDVLESSSPVDGCRSATAANDLTDEGASRYQP